MRASVIRTRSRMERIAHHYFYPPKSTMVRFPLHPFTKGFSTAATLRPKLAAALRAERAAGRIKQW